MKRNPNLTVPMGPLEPLNNSQLQSLYQTVDALTPREQELLTRWLLQLMKPNYARLISRLPRASSMLLLVSAGALYGALFSVPDGSPNDE